MNHNKYKVPYCDCSGAFLSFRACQNRKYYNGEVTILHPHKPARADAPTLVDQNRPDHCSFCGHHVCYEYDCMAYCECNHGAIEFEEVIENMPLFPTEPIRNRCKFCGGLVFWERPSRDQEKNEVRSA